MESAAASGWSTPRWVAPVLGLLSFLLVLVAGGALVGDWTLRNSEMRDLVTAIEASEQEMRIANERRDDALAPFGIGGDLTPEETALLIRNLAGIAADSRQRIDRAGAKVSAVWALPWHADVLRAQEGYVVHNRAWVDYMARAAQDPIEWFNPQPLVNSSFFAVEPLLTSAVPIPALFDLHQRVAKIFIEGTPADVVADEQADVISS